MLLRATISSTKNFLKKTLCNFKSFFSNSYHRLPKAPPSFPIVSEMDKDSTFHFTSSQKELQNGSFMKTNNSNVPIHISKNTTIDETPKERDEKNEDSIKIGATHQRKMEEDLENCCWKRRMCLVAKKMKELEKLDARNVDHALDIEEILHYYSHLTSPTFLEIVDKFFMDIFAEFSAHSSSQQTRYVQNQC